MLGTLAFNEGKIDEAVRELQGAAEQNSCAGLLPELGVALEQAGQSDSAISVYERNLASMRPDHFCRFALDPVWRATVLKRLGQIYEARNDTTNAIKYHNQFVELWKNADPELQPQVEDVRGRIARLVGEGQR